MLDLHSAERSEWLEADGLGGYAMGTAAGVRTRRYHSLLTAATTPPTGRITLVNGLEVTIEAPGGAVALSTHRYAPDVLNPDGVQRLVEFRAEPWPTFVYALPDGHRLVCEIFLRRGAPLAAVRFGYEDGATRPGLLRVRPLLSGRPHHALHRENPEFLAEPAREGETIVFRPYRGIPSVAVLSNGRYAHAPEWYRGFLYTVDRERGHDHVEDLASPGEFVFDLGAAPAVLLFAADGQGLPAGHGAETAYRSLRSAELSRRRRAGDPLRLAAADYFVRRDDGLTVLAGYPWYTDRVRDAFGALRGLGLAAGRTEDAREVLLTWARRVEGGLLPDVLPEAGGAAEAGSPDASLWFVVAADEYLRATEGRRVRPTAAERRTIAAAVESVVAAFAAGTRHGIGADADGLLRVGGTGPRPGKAVDVQALWLNALRAGGKKWQALLDRAAGSFRRRFWREDEGYLADVVDAGGEQGRDDRSFRAEQILAAGGLPFSPLSREQARRVTDAVARRLLGPGGLRPSEDATTAWPWLLGPFVSAFLYARGDTDEARREARERFLPALATSPSAARGHLPETAGGCPFQAWSLGERIRLDRLLGARSPS